MATGVSSGYWWSRSPHPIASNLVNGVNNDGSVSKNNVSNGIYGMAPALRLSLAG